QFLQSGKIEFERKTNTHRLYYSGEDSWMEEMKKYVPQFKTDYFELHFNSTRSLYKPGRESDDKRTGFFEAPGSENVVFKDLSKQQFVSQKKVFESLFLVSDSMPPMEWKIEG